MALPTLLESSTHGRLVLVEAFFVQEHLVAVQAKASEAIHRLAWKVWPDTSAVRTTTNTACRMFFLFAVGSRTVQAVESLGEEALDVAKTVEVRSIPVDADIMPGIRSVSFEDRLCATGIAKRCDAVHSRILSIEEVLHHRSMHLQRVLGKVCGDSGALHQLCTVLSHWLVRSRAACTGRSDCALLDHSGELDSCQASFLIYVAVETSTCNRVEQAVRVCVSDLRNQEEG